MRATLPRSPVFVRAVSLACAAAMLTLALAFDAAEGAARTAEPPIPLAEILARFRHAYTPGGEPAERTTLETIGTVAGEGLTGTFHGWEDGDRERNDQQLGMRIERTLRLGDRVWVQNAAGNVRELHGVLLRRTRTDRFVDTGAFADAPDRVRYAGEATIAKRRAFNLEVTAPDGDTESVYLDEFTYLPLRLQYLDGDGPTWVDPSDWREIAGRMVAYRSVISDGAHAFDIVERTTEVRAGVPIDASVFAPLQARRLEAPAAQSVALVEHDGHYFCTARVNGHPYTFLIDSGAQNILIDSRVARELRLPEEGAMEVRGAQRTGGLHSVRVRSLAIGEAHLDDIVVSSIDIGSATGGTFRLDGILGYPLFGSAVVKIDFAARQMQLSAPGSFTPAGTKIALDVDRGLAEATLGFGQGRTAPFVVDTGNSSELLLYRPYVDRHPGVVPFTGVHAANYGIGGTSSSYRTVLDELDFGGYPLYHRITDVVLESYGAFADRFDAGNVGTGVLRNFVLTFDEPNEALYVERGDAFDDGRMRRITIGEIATHR